MHPPALNTGTIKHSYEKSHGQAGYDPAAAPATNRTQHPARRTAKRVVSHTLIHSTRSPPPNCISTGETLQKFPHSPASSLPIKHRPLSEHTLERNLHLRRAFQGFGNFGLLLSSSSSSSDSQKIPTGMTLVWFGLTAVSGGIGGSGGRINNNSSPAANQPLLENEN